MQEIEFAPSERPLPNFMMEPDNPDAEAEEGPDAAEVFDSAALAAPAGDYEQSSISHLMQRLELGLLRRDRQGWEGPAAETRQNNDPSPKLDQRLRSAIDDLQRLAARGG